MNELISAMSDLGSRSRDGALTGLFLISCGGLSEPLSSNKTYFLKTHQKTSSDRSIFSCPLLANICKMPPSHLTWVMPDASYVPPPPPPGTVANTPEFTSTQFHENQRKQTMGRRGSSTEKPACLLRIFVAPCLYSFIRTVHMCVWPVQA